MAKPVFNPASLDLLPGESPRPPLRLLEPRACRRGSRGNARPVAALPTPGVRHWLERLYQVASRPVF